MKKIVIGLLILASVVAFSITAIAQSEQGKPDPSQSALVSSLNAVSDNKSQGLALAGGAGGISGICCNPGSGNGNNLPPCHNNLQSGEAPSNQLPQGGENAYPGATSGANNVVY